LPGKEHCDRSAHAGTEDADLLRLVLKHESVRRAQILDLAAVGHLLELPLRLSRAGEVETQGENSALRQLPAQRDDLLALLARLHAVAENYRRVRPRRRMMQDAGELLHARVGECNSLFTCHRNKKFLPGLPGETN
jgi:hypothetical protein